MSITKMQGFAATCCALVLVCLAGLNGSAIGATIHLETSQGTYDLSSDDVGNVTDLGNDTILWEGEWEESPGGSDGWEAAWSLTLKADPGVAGVVTVTNGNPTTDTFFFDAIVPVTVAVPAGSPMEGSSSISISDANFNGSGSLAAPAGSAIYQGRIDGVTQRSLFVDPFLMTAPSRGTSSGTMSFSGESTSTDLDVGDLLSIRHTFVLSSGDTATGNSTFLVIPEPATCLLGLVVAMPLWLGRRRSC